MGPAIGAAAAWVGANAAAIGAVTAVAGTAYSIHQGRQQAGAQRRANRAQERLQRARQVRENQQAVRRRRIAAAQVAARAEAMGVQGSSGEAGAISSLGAQTAGSIGHAGHQRAIGGQISAFNQAAATAAGRAQLGQVVSGIGTQMMGPGGYAGVFEDAFQKRAGGPEEQWIGQFGGTWSTAQGYTPPRRG